MKQKLMLAFCAILAFIGLSFFGLPVWFVVFMNMDPKWLFLLLPGAIAFILIHGIIEENF
jgi:hypothetical protein